MPRFVCAFVNVIAVILLPLLPVAQEKDAYFTKLTETDGLTDNHISCIMQDHTGYIWIGTFYGLNRYDGYTVEHFVYDATDTNSLAGNYVTSITEDKDGKLWVGCAKTGALSCYNPLTKKFTRFYHDSANKSSLPDNEVDNVFIDSKNRVWIGFFGAGWAIYNQQAKTFTSFKSPKLKGNAYSLNVYDIAEEFAEDSKGRVWIATNGALYCQDAANKLTEYTDTIKQYNSFADNLFTSMYMQDDSTLWLGTWAAGLKKFNTNTHKFTQYLYDVINPVYGVKNIVLKMTPKAPGELWVGTSDKGLGIFNITTGTFKFFPHNDAEPNSPYPYGCNWVFTDRQGSLWAGYDMGILRWFQQSSNFQFVPVTNTNLKYGPIGIGCFYKDTATGLLYTGGEGGKGLYIVNEKTGRQDIVPFTDPENFAEDNYDVTCIVPFDDKRLLVLATNGLSLYNTQTGIMQRVHVKTQYGWEVNGGSRLARSEDGNWWFSSWAGGCYRLDSALTSAIYYSEQNVPALKHFGALVLSEKDSLLWMNNNTLGLQIFNSITKQVHPVRLTNRGLNIREVDRMLKIKEGEYWLTSFAQGLYKLVRNADNTYTATHFGEAEGIPSAFMKTITKDGEGNYWISTRKGPVLYITQKDHFKLFGEGEGYKAALWIFESVYAAGDGTMYFTGVGGYARANLQALYFNTQPSPLILKSFKVLGKEFSDSLNLANTTQIELPYSRNFFSVEFVLLNYISTQANKYVCMLKGVDKDFVSLGGSRFVSYADLSPGEYTLYIKAANNDGVWNDKMITLSIIINPPFWRTWLFYILVAIVVGSLGFIGYRYHINNIRKEEKLKTAFNKKVAEIEMKALRAQMNPHFIFNCLNSINRYIIKSDHITASGYLTRFSKLIRLILDNSIADTTSLDNEIQLVHLYLEMEELRYDGRFTYSIETDSELLSETIMIPSMLIQPYAENAIWHGLLHKQGIGHLSIQFKLQEKNTLKIEIEDNGIGREQSAALKSKNALKNKSYGMQITGDRINIANQLYNLKASAVVEDLVYTDGSPAGTRVTLLIPFERQINTLQ